MTWARKIPWRLLALLFGAGLLAYMIIDLGPGAVARELVAVGPAFLLMPAVALLGLVVRAFGMPLLLDPEDRPGPGAAVASRLASYALNQVLPAFGVGGEPSRLLWMPPERRHSGIPVLILDRALLILADALFVLIVALVAIGGVALPEQLRRGSLLTVGLALLVAFSLIWVTVRHGIAGPVFALLARLRIRAARDHLGRAREVDAAVRSLWRASPERLAGAFALQFASRLLIAAEIWIGLALLGVRTGPVGALLVAATPIAANVVFAFIPSQLGAQEAGMALVFGALGMPPATGIILSLLQRLSLIVTLAIGFVLLALAPRHPVTGEAGGAREAPDGRDAVRP